MMNQIIGMLEGGNSVLMEQFTATWCDVCAQIDPLDI
jgi:hypothetical protein